MSRYFKSFVAASSVYAALAFVFFASTNTQLKATSSPSVQKIELIQRSIPQPQTKQEKPIQQTKPQAMQPPEPKPQKQTVQKPQLPTPSSAPKLTAPSAVEVDPVTAPEPKPQPKVLKPQETKNPKPVNDPTSSFTDKKKQHDKFDSNFLPMLQNSINRKRDIDAKIAYENEQRTQQKKEAFFKHIRNKIEENKHYPRVAKRRGLQGSVEVVFTIAADGTLDSVVANSGNNAFNSATKDAVYKTFPLEYDVNGLELPMQISFTVDYRLR